MEVKGNMEAALKSINKKLSDYRGPARPPSIYKVHHHYLREINDNVYEPRVVAVGPYHRGKQGLEMMEELKVQYMKSLLLRGNANADRYVSAVAETQEEARSHYAQKLSLSSAEFIEMLVLDGCFLIELVSKFQRRDSSCASDPIFQMKWIIAILRRDLILFENQIPFFVLCKLFDLINEESDQHWKLMDSFLSFLRLYRSNGINVRVEEVRHLLLLLALAQTIFSAP